MSRDDYLATDLGERLFHERTVFTLVDTKRFSSGIVVLTYEPGPSEGEEANAK